MAPAAAHNELQGGGDVGAREARLLPSYRCVGLRLPWRARRGWPLGRPCRPRPLVARDGSKTSELCNRLILLDQNKINLVLIFYAL
jgi:hypothetical protein